MSTLFLPPQLIPSNHSRLLRASLIFTATLIVSACDTADDKNTDSSSQADTPMARLLETSPESDAKKDTGDKVLAEDEALAMADEVGSFGHNRYSPMIAHDEEISDLGATLFGDYSGVYPCKDCKAKNVVLNLNIDGSVVKTTSKVQSKRPTSVTRQLGHYHQKGSVIIIDFDDNSREYYLIDESRLLLLPNDKALNDQQDLLSFTDIDYTLSRL